MGRARLPVAPSFVSGPGKGGLQAMIEWAIAAAVFVVLGLVLVWAIPRMTMRTRKGGGGGFAIGLMMVFASLIDPARAAAVEQLDRQKETEGAEEGQSGAGPD
jgi:hypothetical protein